MKIIRIISFSLKILNSAFAAYLIYILISIYIYYQDNLNSQSIDGVLLNQDNLIISFRTLTSIIKLLSTTLAVNILFLFRVSFRNENIHIKNKFLHYSLILFLIISVIYLFLFWLDSAASIKYEVESYYSNNFYIDTDYFSNQILKLLTRISLVLLPLGLFIYHSIRNIKISKK